MLKLLRSIKITEPEKSESNISQSIKSSELLNEESLTLFTIESVAKFLQRLHLTTFSLPPTKL